MGEDGEVEDGAEDDVAAVVEPADAGGVAAEAVAGERGLETEPAGEVEREQQDEDVAQQGGDEELAQAAAGP